MSEQKKKRTGRGGPSKPISKNPKIINPNREVPKGSSHLRSKSTIKRLAMYNKKAVRNKDGKFLGGEYMSRTPDARIKRIDPNKGWFINSRTVTQKDLTTFREEMGQQINNPYKVIMRAKKLPLSLLDNPYQHAKMNLLTTQSFEHTFGKKKLRKKPKLEADQMDAMMSSVNTKLDGYSADEDGNIQKPLSLMFAKDKALEAGTSKRIWQELYKVIDSADVLIQVLDARDPMGTRCKRIENELKSAERRHKHLIFVLNKVDLVPTWVTARWVQVLSQEYPTLAFHASITNPFGKGSLLQLLKQFSALHKDRKQISVGFIGYPNVGKSSIINTLKKKKVCKSAPIPGETKIWQYITLFKRIFLIDCPGVVYPGTDTDENLVLKGVVRIETLSEPAAFVDEVLRRVKREYICRTYGIGSWTSPLDFLEQFARKAGKMRRGAEPDVSTAGRMILNDWIRGRLPYFELPPLTDEKKAAIQARKQLHVEQMFNKISVRTKFSPEDVKPPAGVELPPSAEAAPTEENEDLENEEEEEGEGDSEGGEEGDEEGEQQGEEAQDEEEDEEEDDEEDEEEEQEAKQSAQDTAQVVQTTETAEQEEEDADLKPDPPLSLEQARALEWLRREKAAGKQAEVDWDNLYKDSKGPKTSGKRKRKQQSKA